MGRRGPKSQPAAVKQARGNPSRRPIGADPDSGSAQAVDEVAKPSGQLAPPKWMKPPAREIWDRLAPRLRELKLLTTVDAETFARYCTNFARWLKLQPEMDRDGVEYWTESAHGKMKRVNPAFLVADRLDRRLEAVEDRFGLNPAQRQSLFAQRAALGSSLGDLFDQPQPSKPTNAAKPQEPRSPLGLLN